MKQPTERPKDSVIDAATFCLLAGFLGSIFVVGIPFLFAAFVLGIYAMATHRFKQGVIISLIASVLLVVFPILVQIVLSSLLLRSFGVSTPHVP